MPTVSARVVTPSPLPIDPFEPVVPEEPGKKPRPRPAGPPLDGVELYVTGEKGKVDEKQDIHFNDIRQGGAGDCYFFCAVAAVAKRNPEDIRNLIRPNLDASGKVTSYTVTLWDKEEYFFGLRERTVRKEIEVKLPLTKSREQAHFGDQVGGKNEIWPLVLEEAFLSLNIGWGDGGPAKNGYFALTGRDSDEVNINGALSSFVSVDLMLRSLQQGRAVMLSSHGKPGEDLHLPGGIVSNHCYMVQGFHYNQAGRLMFDLYNPWGSSEEIFADDLNMFFRKVTVGK